MNRQTLARCVILIGVSSARAFPAALLFANGKPVGGKILRIIQFKGRWVKFLGGCDSKGNYFFTPVLCLPIW